MGLAADDLRVIRCAPHPQRWAEFHSRHQIAWNYVPFDVSNTSQVPDEPGIYCFLVGPPQYSLPQVGYPMYIGKTERTLRKRFKEYIDEENDDKGRVRVRKFLKVFSGELVFASTIFKGSRKETLAMETEIMTAVMPAYSDLGFTATQRARRSAWQ